MSEREYSQDEERVESGEVQESQEAPEARELEQATQEPEAHVEATREYQEAEQIETVITEVVEAEIVPDSGEGSRDDEPPNPPQGSEEVSATPITLPSTPGDEGATPLPIPRPEEQVVQEASPPSEQTEEIEVIPLPIPEPKDEVEGRGVSAENEGATPLPIPRPEEQVVQEASPPGEQAEEIEVLPLPMPDPKDETTEEGEVVGQREEAEGIPLPLPGQREEAEGIPVPLPYPEDGVVEMPTEAEEEHVEFKFFTPAPTDEGVEEGDVAGRGEDIENIPLPIPGQKDGAEGQDVSSPGDLAEGSPIDIPPGIIDDVPAEGLVGGFDGLTDPLEGGREGPGGASPEIGPRGQDLVSSGGEADDGISFSDGVGGAGSGGSIGDITPDSGGTSGVDSMGQNEGGVDREIGPDFEAGGELDYGDETGAGDIQFGTEEDGGSMVDIIPDEDGGGEEFDSMGEDGAEWDDGSGFDLDAGSELDYEDESGAGDIQFGTEEDGGDSIDIIPDEDTGSGDEDSGSGDEETDDQQEEEAAQDEEEDDGDSDEESDDEETITETEEDDSSMPRPDGSEEDDRRFLSEDDLKYENLAIDSVQQKREVSGIDQQNLPGLVSDPAENQGPDVPDSGVKHDPSQITDPGADELSKGRSETTGEE